MNNHIKNLNQSYEYVSIARCINDSLFDMVRDSIISAKDVMIWQYLYQQARFDEELTTIISYSRIADRLGFSKTTVVNGIKKMEGLGFLSITRVTTSSLQNMTNSIQVCIPDELYQKLIKSEQKRKRADEPENLSTGVVQNLDHGWYKKCTDIIRKNNSNNKQRLQASPESSPDVKPAAQPTTAKAKRCVVSQQKNSFVPSDKRNDKSTVIDFTKKQIEKRKSKLGITNTSELLDEAISYLASSKANGDLFMKACIFLKKLDEQCWTTPYAMRAQAPPETPKPRVWQREAMPESVKYMMELAQGV